MFQELSGRFCPGSAGSTAPTQTVPARTTCRIPSNHGREEFVLVRLRPATPDLATPDLATPQAVITAAAAAAGPGTAGPVWLAEPLATRSGLITPLSCCDGYLRIERDLEGLKLSV
jgi:molybdopterin biosynthesis enzyme